MYVFDCKATAIERSNRRSENVDFPGTNIMIHQFEHVRTHDLNSERMFGVIVFCCSLPILAKRWFHLAAARAASCQMGNGTLVITLS